MGWTWESGSPNERAAFIRCHRDLTDDDLRKLFCLTERGLLRIMGGDDWMPEYSTETK